MGGTLLAFGCNKHGQLGMGDTFDRMTPTEVLLQLAGEGAAPVRAMQVQSGISHSLVLVQTGGRLEVRASGDNGYGQLGLGDRDGRHTFHPVPALRKAQVVCVCSGDWHNAAITADGRLYMWGRGDCGQLGHGDDRNRWVPTELENFSVIHPDRTLRRNRKPPMKTLLLEAEEGERPRAVSASRRTVAGIGNGSAGKGGATTRSQASTRGN